MVVFFISTDPYIAGRNGEKNGVVFEGSKKECENYLLDWGLAVTMNNHIKKFHPEKFGKNVYYVKEV